MFTPTPTPTLTTANLAVIKYFYKKSLSRPITPNQLPIPNIEVCIAYIKNSYALFVIKQGYFTLSFSDGKLNCIKEY